MSGRYVDIGISSDETGLVYTVNTTSKITEKDIEAHNGIIHVISEVLSPTENTLVEVISADQDFSLFFEALQATGLDKNISLIKDEDYVPDPDYVTRENTGVVYNYARVRVPRERKYGFTALMESNETFKKNGINNLDDLKAYAKQAYDKLYPQDASISDITNRNNSLNRFVAYHLINKKLPMRLFIEKYDNTGMNYESTGETHSVKVVDMFEYLETLCPNTLIEVRTLRTTNEYNIFNMIPESGKAIRLTANFDNDALNGVYHEIDNILVYTAEVERMLSTKRLRMDVASFFPEFVNNNIRIGNSRVGGGLYSERYYLPMALWTGLKPLHPPRSITSMRMTGLWITRETNCFFQDCTISILQQSLSLRAHMKYGLDISLQGFVVWPSYTGMAFQREFRST